MTASPSRVVDEMVIGDGDDSPGKRKKLIKTPLTGMVVVGMSISNEEYACDIHE